VHSPVLLQEVIENLDIKSGSYYIDATAGEGGHLLEILKRGGRVMAIDVDDVQIEELKKRFRVYIDRGELTVLRANFSSIEKLAKENNYYPVYGILIDLGLSYRQISSSGKGFSYRNLNEKLDMRLGKKVKKNAEDIVNSFTKDQLYELFAKYSEDINSRSIAEGIVRARTVKRIETVGDLLEVIKKVLSKKDIKTEARIFQALRITVNNEMENLKKALSQSANLLVKGGRLLVISFHSLEDRIVKTFVKRTDYYVPNLLIKGDRSLSYERSAKLRVLIRK